MQNLFLLCLLVLALMQVAPGVAQDNSAKAKVGTAPAAVTETTAPGPRACSPEDIDVTAQMGDGAHSQQTLTFDFHNNSGGACVLRDRLMLGGAGGADACTNKGSSDDCVAPAPFLLQPGQVAHAVFGWNTGKTGEHDQCSDVSRLSAYRLDPAASGSALADDEDEDSTSKPKPFYTLHIGEQTNFRIRVCSVAKAGPYFDGPSSVVPAAVHAEPDMHIVLSKDYDTYYLDDSVKLHLDIERPFLGLSSGLEGDLPNDICWEMIVMQQTKSVDGVLRVELGNMANNPAYPLTCGLAPDRHLKMEKDIYEGYYHTDENDPPLLPDETVSYSIVRGTNRLWRDVAATSNSLVIHHADPALLPHPWGEQTDGFAVSLTLDKDRFGMGTAFRVHLACARLGKDWKQKGYVEKVDPLCMPDTALTDSNGNPVAKRSDSWEPWTGHGSDEKVDRTFKAGQALYREQTLVPGGAFPYGHTPLPKLVPGTYYLTAFWDAEDDFVSPPLRVVARSHPVKFEISAGP